MVYTSPRARPQSSQGQSSSQVVCGIKKENLSFESLKEGLLISFSMYVFNPRLLMGLFLWRHLAQCF